ncbi:MAG: mechanosensitive ion channel family protein [Longimicrobiales bacterium]
MIQLPIRLPSADSARPQMRIDWNQLLLPDVLARHVGRVLIILLVSFVAYRLIKLLVKRIVSHEVETEDPIVKRLREQRAQTLGSLLQNVALIVIIILAALTILGTFMPIGPLLAGVSVIGLAVSFGAQSLVKDIISGTFILLEGQFGIGDVVRIGDTAGQVERITLRTSVLRDFEGVVHIIPNGEITKVSNLTKTWSRAVLDVGVAYREDTDRVTDVLRNLGHAFLADPEWAPLLLEEPEVLGVQSLGESSVVIRMQVRTLPLKQWDVARELRRRIKKRFDAEGIQIPFPHLTFYWGDQQAPFNSESAPFFTHPSARK